MYPENWKLSDQPDEPLPRAITLEAPDGGAIWSVHLYPADSDSHEILEQTLAPLRDTYEDLEVSTAAQDFSNDEPAVDALFFCLDFLVHTKLQVVNTQEYKLILWYQSEDREFDKLSMVFKAISTSLIQSVSV